MRIAFFGHDAGDAAVRRRAVAFERAGFGVLGVMPRRGPPKETPWPLIDLGQTHDGAYAQRVASIFRGARRAARGGALREAGLLYARNLDMLATAALVKRRLGLGAPLVYECLDVHHRLTGTSASARTLRRLEGGLLRGCALVVVSSPRFVAEHFARHHAGRHTAVLVENRLVEGDAFPPRPKGPGRSGGPLRIGWFGNLRCVRSLGLLTALAERLGPKVEIILRGYPAEGVMPDLHEALAPHPDMRFEGRYKAPDDLASIYGEVDLAWAGDWYEEGANSLWLLPNRVYEGGYFGVPAIAPGGTETATWLDRRDAGFVLDGPPGEALPALIERLAADRAPIEARRAALLALPRETFVEGPETMRAVVAAAMGDQSAAHSIGVMDSGAERGT